MHCPICDPRQALRAVTLEPKLIAHECPGCGGHWMRHVDYWRWCAEGGAESTKDSPSPDPVVIGDSDSTGLKRCPDCRHILGRYRVGRRVPFAIDRCRNCDGTWLDRDEWAALRDTALHADLHLVFSEEWQKQARRDEQQRLAEGRLRRHFGDAEFERLREMRSWLDDHPRRGELLAYLLQGPVE